MDFLNRLEAAVAKAPSQIQHAALWLLGAVTAARRELRALESSDPLIATAIRVGEAAAVSHGVPLAEIETAGEDVLKIALAISGPPPAPAPATLASVAQPGSIVGAVTKTLVLMLAIGVALAMTACTRPPGTSPATGTGTSAVATASAAEAALAAAGKTALGYDKLPACTGSNGPMCADPGIKAKIRTAYDAAYQAVTAAQATADGGGSPDMAAASAALSVLEGAVAVLPNASKQGG